MGGAPEGVGEVAEGVAEVAEGGQPVEKGVEEGYGEPGHRSEVRA